MSTDTPTVPTPDATPDAPTVDAPPVTSKPRATKPARVVPASPFPGHVPTAVRAFTAMVRAIIAMPVDTPDHIRAATSTAVRAASAVVDAPMPAGMNGRWSGLGIRYAQNMMYVAIAMSGIPVARIDGGHIVAMWAAELPHARCPFAERPGYGMSTLTDYVNGRHGDVPMADDATARTIVRTWRDAKPSASNATTTRVRTRKTA